MAQNAFRYFKAPVPGLIGEGAREHSVCGIELGQTAT